MGRRYVSTLPAAIISSLSIETSCWSALMEFLSAHTEGNAIPLKLGGANSRPEAARSRKRA
jgi:hypothetical protein